MLPRSTSERVRLRVDLPERLIPKGSIGRVRSTWQMPGLMYEVEFETPGQSFPSRVLLRGDQIDLVREAAVENESNDEKDVDQDACVCFG